MSRNFYGELQQTKTLETENIRRYSSVWKISPIMLAYNAGNLMTALFKQPTYSNHSYPSQLTHRVLQLLRAYVSDEHSTFNAKFHIIIRTIENFTDNGRSGVTVLCPMFEYLTSLLESGDTISGEKPKTLIALVCHSLVVNESSASLVLIQTAGLQLIDKLLEATKDTNDLDSSAACIRPLLFNLQNNDCMNNDTLSFSCFSIASRLFGKDERSLLNPIVDTVIDCTLNTLYNTTDECAPSPRVVCKCLELLARISKATVESTSEAEAPVPDSVTPSTPSSSFFPLSRPSTAPSTHSSNLHMIAQALQRRVFRSWSATPSSPLLYTLPPPPPQLNGMQSIRLHPSSIPLPYTPLPPLLHTSSTSTYATICHRY